MSEPKALWLNDVINVVCGSDVREPGFSSRTPHDGVDLEFDGLCEMFITVRYTRYAYTNRNFSLTGGCDPLLYSLICRGNPYNTTSNNGGDFLNHDEEIGIDDDINSVIIVRESEFEDTDGRLYRVTNVNSVHEIAVCIYPKHNNAMHGCKKSFDVAVAKDLIRQRLSG